MSAANEEAWGALRARFGFRPPTLYRRLWEAGAFTPFTPQHLQFSDLSWLAPAQIAAWRFHHDQIPGLVPIAVTGQQDLWCWYPRMNDGGDAPVVFCPDEDEVAHVHAPDFTAWLYRLVLEEFACTGLTEHVDVRQSRAMLLGFVEFLAADLPSAWVERLRELAARVPRRDANDYYGVLDADELDTILVTDIRYARLDEEFLHVREDGERPSDG